MISERPKAALAAAKRRGQRLGNPNLTEVAKRGTATGKANARWSCRAVMCYLIVIRADRRPGPSAAVIFISGACLRDPHVRQEAARVHHAGRRCGGVAARRARATAQNNSTALLPYVRSRYVAVAVAAI